MSLLLCGILWISCWILIIALYTFTHRKLDGFVNAEIIEDGNNLFKTGLAYFIGDVICYYVHLSLIQWGIFIITVIPAIICLFSSLILLFQNGVHFIQKVSALINTICPLLLSFNILFSYLL